MAALKAVRPLLRWLDDHAAGDEEFATWRRQADRLRADLLDHVSQLDLGTSDTEHFVRMIDETTAVVSENGLAGLGRYLSGRLDELDRVRSSPDRGTRQASFPWWKIVIAAIWLGVTIVVIWRAVTTGAPWWDFAAIAFIALVGFVLIALGC